MQRYQSGGCTSAVNNSAISGIQPRDTSRADSPSLPPNYSLNSRCKEIAMSKVEDSKKKSGPQLVKLDRSFKLAEQWVNNMSKPSGNERSTVVELEGRPSRLGIGATVPRESTVAHANNSIERALLSKLQADKRKAIKRAEDLETSTKDKVVDEDSEEDETESKTKAFSKKRPLSLTSPLHAKKKHR